MKAPNVNPVGKTRHIGYFLLGKVSKSRAFLESYFELKTQIFEKEISTKDDLNHKVLENSISIFNEMSWRTGKAPKC